MVACIVSGLIVSEVALPLFGLGTGHDAFWGGLHDATANLLLVGVGVHLALHWAWIRSVFRRIRSGPRAPWRAGVWRNAVRPVPLAAILGAMLAIGIFALPLESSPWAQGVRAAALERQTGEESPTQPGADTPTPADASTEPAPGAEGQPREARFPPWARYVLPFVKQGILMGIPALICAALLGILALFRRRRHRGTAAKVDG